MKRGLKPKKSTGRQTLVSKVSYVKRNWQLYVFFLMPALVLTIIFKYLPMGGLLIAFEDYQTVFILTGFYELSVKHIKTQHLWTALGFSDSNYPGIITEPDP